MARKPDPLLVGSAALVGLGMLYFATRKKKEAETTAGGGTVTPASTPDEGTRREGTDTTPAAAGPTPGSPGSSVLTPGGITPARLLPSALTPPTSGGASPAPAAAPSASAPYIFPQPSRFSPFQPLPASAPPSGGFVPRFPAGRGARGFIPAAPRGLGWIPVPLNDGSATFEPGRRYRISQEARHYWGTLSFPNLIDHYYSRSSNFEDTSAWNTDSKPSDWPAEDNEPRYRIEATYVGSVPMTRVEAPAYGATTYVYVLTG